MRKPSTLVLAIAGAVAVHAIVLLYGGLLAPAAPEKSEKPDDAAKERKRPQVVTIASKTPAKQTPPAPTEPPQANPPKKAEAPPPPKTELAKEQPTKPEPTPPQPPPAQELAEATPKPPQPALGQAQAARPTEVVATETPKQPEPPAATPPSPPPAAQAGLAAIASDRASDAQVSSEGDGAEAGPAAAAATTLPPLPPLPPMPTATTQAAAPASPPAVPPITSPPSPQPTQGVVKAAVTLAPPPPLPVGRPAPSRLSASSGPSRMGPAWERAKRSFGTLPPPSPAPTARLAVTPAARRAQEIPPVDVNAVTPPPAAPYRPVHTGDERPGDRYGMQTLAAAAESFANMPPPAPRPQGEVQPQINLSAPATTGEPSGAAATADAGTGSGRGQGASSGSGAGTRTRDGAPSDRGRLAPGAKAPQEPVARIAWGSAQEALATLDASRMQLVVVDAELNVVGGVDRTTAVPARIGVPPQMVQYSNRVRVVDQVAGFADFAAVCGPSEHLAVIVPIGLDRRIEKAMDAAARREGLSRQEVAACYGRLVTQPTGVEFQIERVERRNSP